MSPTEVQQYFKAHESEFAQPESVTLNEILIPTPAKSAAEGADTAEVAAAQAQADAIESETGRRCKVRRSGQACTHRPQCAKERRAG